jgi:hypothetical protein
MKGGVRGKYVARLRKGSNLVLLDPEVAAAFPSAEAVNEALRGALNTTRAVRDRAACRPRRFSRRAAGIAREKRQDAQARLAAERQRSPHTDSFNVFWPWFQGASLLWCTV